MRAQKLARFGIEHGFHHALGLAHRNCLAVADKGEAADFHLIARLNRLCFGHAHGRDLRMAIGAAGNAARLDRVRMAACDQLGHHHALMAGFVSQPWRTRDITDGIKARNPSAAEFVRHNMGAVDLDAKRLQPQPFDIADDTNCGNNRIKFCRYSPFRIFQVRGHANTRLAVQLLDRGLFQDLHALFDKGLLGKGADLGVLHRQHTVHHLTNRDIRPQGVEEAGKLDPNRTRSDHQKLFRHAFGLQGVAIGPNQIAVRLQPRQFARPRAGGQNDRLGAQLLNALIGFHRNNPRLRQRRRPHEDRDLVLLHQMANATRKLLCHPTRAGHDSIQIVGDALHRQAKLLGAVHQMEHFGRAQQGLGRDAAPVQADAAQILALDDRHLLAELRGTNGRHIAARPRANHHNIKALACHLSLPQKSSLPLNYLIQPSNNPAAHPLCIRCMARTLALNFRGIAPRRHKRRLCGRCISPKGRIAKGKPAKLRDDDLMHTGMQRHLGVRRQTLGQKAHSKLLIRRVFRMFKGHVEKLPLRLGRTHVPAGLNRLPRRRQSAGIRGKGQGGAAVHVARQLIADHQIGQSAHSAIDPVLQPTLMRGLPQIQEARAALVIQRLTPGIPALWANLAQPELQHFNRVRHRQHSLTAA